MQRIKSHFEEQEAFLEKYLRYLRFRKIIKYIRPNCKLLDLGCGYNGDFLKQVSNIISAGIGIDISVREEKRREEKRREEKRREENQVD